VNVLDTAVYAGPALGVMAGLFCLLVMRKQRAQHGECARQIAQLTRQVADLQLSHQNIEDVSKGGLPRSRCSQAMQLLRSGMPAESVASSLGMATREMRLIAEVARMLSLQ
jgi:hypothetical protein